MYKGEEDKNNYTNPAIKRVSSFSPSPTLFAEKNIVGRAKFFNPMKDYRVKNIENATPKEKLFKGILERNKIPFQYQKVFGTKEKFYIVDFFIPKPFQICFEIDGWQHLTSRVNYDTQRTSYLEVDRKFKVFRYRNEEVVDSHEFETELIKKIKENVGHNKRVSFSQPPSWAFKPTQNKTYQRKLKEKEALISTPIFEKYVNYQGKLCARIVLSKKDNPQFKLYLAKNQCESIVENIDAIREFSEKGFI